MTFGGILSCLQRVSREKYADPLIYLANFHGTLYICEKIHGGIQWDFLFTITAQIYGMCW